MIISHKYKFIFLHVPKAAGSAIKVSLFPHLGPEDLVVGSVQDALMQGVSLNEATMRMALRPRRARWFFQAAAVPFRGRRGWAYWMGHSVKRYWLDVYGLRTHSSAEACRAAFPEEFRDYERIAVVRNPWDAFVSNYYWSFRDTPESRRPTFDQFISAVYKNQKEYGGSRERAKLPGRFYFYDNGDFVLTDMIRFEDLGNEWERIRRKLGLPEEAALARAKSHTRQGRPYRDEYSEQSRDMVGEMCSREIEFFGYQF